MEKKLVYNNIFIPIRFIKKEAYVNLEDHKNIINKREKVIDELEEENKKMKEKLDKIEKARIKYEDVFYKVTRQWDDSYGELDEIIMNR